MNLFENLHKYKEANDNNISYKSIQKENDELSKLNNSYSPKLNITNELFHRQAPDIEEYVQKAIGHVGYDDYKLSKALLGGAAKQNFMIQLSPYKVHNRDEINMIKQAIKDAGGKYIQYSRNQFYFYFDTTKFIDKQKEDQAKFDKEYQDAINSIDIDKYKPTEKIIQKLIDYRNRGSKVNIKAIKSIDKLLTYLYGANLIGWGDLSFDIYRIIPYEYDDIKQAIDKRVKLDPQYSDTRTNGVKSLQNVLPKVAKYLRENGIEYDFVKRTPNDNELDMDRRNGRCWTIAYTLKINNIEIQFANHTNEGGGTYGYSGLGYDTVSQTEISNRIIQYIQDNI